MNERVRVLIADDHAVVRQGLRALQPDVILLDLLMPRQDGIAAIRQIKQERPDAHILVLTSFAEEEKVFPAIKAGALGYLLKDVLPQDLLQAIHNVARGEASLHPSVARKLLQELSQPPALPPAEEPLTEREVAVLRLVARGLSNQEIAEQLAVSEPTVRAHVSNILGKLHLANRTQAALYALRTGIAQLDSG